MKNGRKEKKDNPKTNYAAKHIKKLPASCRHIIMAEFATQQIQNHYNYRVNLNFLTHIKKGKESLL